MPKKKRYCISQVYATVEDKIVDYNTQQNLKYMPNISGNCRLNRGLKLKQTHLMQLALLTGITIAPNLSSHKEANHASQKLQNRMWHEIEYQKLEVGQSGAIKLQHLQRATVAERKK